jgi:eukaryotic-like serine/threonine-protein kinase
LHRQVAIKLHNGSEEVGDEIMREAKVMARVSHPNVITVYEVGSFAGQMFIAMEYIEGGTLRGWLEERQRGVRELLDIYLAAARGLAAAHDVGLVHRDFKPDNVLVGARGQVCVADFGLARQTGLVSVDESTFVDGAVTTTIGGTPAYMSPEQTRGDVLATRSDQYSFCFALCERSTPGSRRKK